MFECVAQPKTHPEHTLPNQHRGQTLPLLEHVEKSRHNTQQLKEKTYGRLLSRGSFVISYHLLFSSFIYRHYKVRQVYWPNNKKIKKLKCCAEWTLTGAINHMHGEYGSQ